MRTFPADVPVGKEFPLLLIVVLLGCQLYEFPVVIECFEEIAGKLAVDVTRGTAVYIEGNAKFLEGFLDEMVVSVHYLLNGNTLFACADGHGNTMLVGPSYENNILFLQSKVSYINVGRNINPCQMTYMNTSVCVRQSCGDGSALKIFVHLS